MKDVTAIVHFPKGAMPPHIMLDVARTPPNASTVAKNRNERRAAARNKIKALPAPGALSDSEKKGPNFGASWLSVLTLLMPMHRNRRLEARRWRRTLVRAQEADRIPPSEPQGGLYPVGKGRRSDHAVRPRIPGFHDGRLIRGIPPPPLHQWRLGPVLPRLYPAYTCSRRAKAQVLASSCVRAVKSGVW